MPVKIQCDSKELFEACRLSSLLTPVDAELGAGPSGLALRATYNEHGGGTLSVALRGVSDGGGAMAIPLNRLRRFCKTCEGEVTITSKDDAVEVKSGRAVMTVMHVKYKNAIPPRHINSPPMSLGENFITALRKVTPFALTNDTHPVLRAVLMESEGYGKMSLVAADGNRLAYATVEGCDAPKMSILISREMCLLLPKLLKGDVRFVLGDIGRVAFGDERVNVDIATVPGEFPNYRSLIPTAKPQWAISCNSKLLQRAVESFDTETVRLCPKGGLLSVSMSGGDDKFITSIPADMSGDGKVAVGQKLLMSALKPFTEVRMEVTSTSSPVKFTGIPESIVAVVMPMFVSW